MRPDWPLETERLVLRPYTDGDLENLHSIYSLPEVARWLYYGPTTLEESRQKLARKIGGSELTEDQLVRVSRLLGREPDLDHVREMIRQLDDGRGDARMGTPAHGTIKRA